MSSSRQIFERGDVGEAAGSRGKVRKMEKVDKLIEELPEHIGGILFGKNERENEVAEKTKALAELISARAHMF